MPRTRIFSERDVKDAPVGKKVHVADVPRLHFVKPRPNVVRYFYRYTLPREHKVTEIAPGKTGIGIPLSRAKEVATHFNDLLRDGIDPQEAMRWQHAETMTFLPMAKQWIEAKKVDEHGKPRSRSWLEDTERSLLVHAKPLHDLPLNKIVPKVIHEALKNQTRGQAKRTAERIKNVMAYVQAKGLPMIGYNPAEWSILKQLFPPAAKKPKKDTSIPPEQMREFMEKRLRQLRTTTAVALEMVILTGCRRGSAVQMRWNEIDWDNKVWNVPAEHMKGGVAFRIPLCDHLINLLRSQQRYAGGSPFVFPGRGRRDRHITPRSLLHLLHDTMNERSTVHDFRRSFRNWGFKTFRGDGDRELLEMCMSHQLKNKVEGAYLTIDGLEERRPIMEAWAAFCGGG